jgi:phosphoglycerate dehydrogenase-like enzyme
MTARPKVLLWASPADGAIEAALAAMPQIDLTISRGAEIPATTDVEALILPAYYVSPALVERLVPANSPALRWMHLTSAGYDNVRRFALPPAITLSCSPGAGAKAIAEHGLGLMLALTRGLLPSLEQQAHRRWDYGVAAHIGVLRGKTLLIVGFGHIGKALAALALAFGMHVVAINRSGEPEEMADVSAGFADLDRHLPEADIVAIAAPLTRDTEGLIDRRRLSLFKREALLINLSRGGIVETNALVGALSQGLLGGAGLDVTEPEPLPADHPLWSCPNLIITPHIASAGQSADDRAYLAALTARNVSLFVAGDTPVHSVYQHDRWLDAEGR